MGEVEKLASEKAKDKRLRDVYNITLEQQNEQRYGKQNNKCAICGRDFHEFTAFQDHDHRCCPRRLKKFCGKCNRGLLCYLCNKYAVGLIEWMRKMDIPFDRVKEYLEYWTKEIQRKGGYEPKEAPKKSRKRKRGRNPVSTQQTSV